MDNLGDDFSLTTEHGVIDAKSEFALQMHFRAVRPTNVKKIVRLEVRNISVSVLFTRRFFYSKVVARTTVTQSMIFGILTKRCLIFQVDGFNPFTPRSDQHINSLYNFNTLSSRQVILRNSQQRFVWSSFRRISFLLLGVKGLNDTQNTTENLILEKLRHGLCILKNLQLA